MLPFEHCVWQGVIDQGHSARKGHSLDVKAEYLTPKPGPSLLDRLLRGNPGILQALGSRRPCLPPLLLQPQYPAWNSVQMLQKGLLNEWKNKGRMLGPLSTHSSSSQPPIHPSTYPSVYPLPHPLPIYPWTECLCSPNSCTEALAPTVAMLEMETRRK